MSSAFRLSEQISLNDGHADVYCSVQLLVSGMNPNDSSLENPRPHVGDGLGGINWITAYRL